MPPLPDQIQQRPGHPLVFRDYVNAVTLDEGFWQDFVNSPQRTRQLEANKTVLLPLSVGEMTLRLHSALSYSQNSARDLRCALNRA